MDPKNPRNKVVAVMTGGAKNYGYEIGYAFLQKGAKLVVILEPDEEEGSRTSRKLNNAYGYDKTVFIKFDITKDIEALSNQVFKKYKVEVLINHIGFIDESSVEATFEMNAIAVIELSMVFLENVRTDKKGKGGTMINVAAKGGYTVDPYLLYFYASSAAVLGFSRSLAANYDTTGVRVVILRPRCSSNSFFDEAKPWDEHRNGLAALLNSSPAYSADMLSHDIVRMFQTAENGKEIDILDGLYI